MPEVIKQVILGRGKNPTFNTIQVSDEDIAIRTAGELDIKRSVNTSKRNSLLLESDWTQNVDSPLTAEKKAEWSTYRQQLRDITSHAEWPDISIENWPVDPNGVNGHPENINPE